MRGGERGGGRGEGGEKEGEGGERDNTESKEHTTTLIYILSHTSTQTRVVQFPFHSIPSFPWYIGMGWTVGYRHEGWYSLGCSLVHWGT